MKGDRRILSPYISSGAFGSLGVFGSLGAFGSLDSLMSDAERFKDAAPLVVRCRSCTAQSAFSPIADRSVRPPFFSLLRTLTSQQTSMVTSAGVRCPACNAAISPASVQAQLEVQMRAQIARYYEGWTVCDDPTCGQRTRMMGVYGRRCLRPGCEASVAFEVSSLLGFVWFCR